MAIAVIALSSVAGSASSTGGRSLEARSEPQPSRRAAPEHCKSGRRAVPYYRFWTHFRQVEREAVRLAGPGPNARGHTCGFVRYAAVEWRGRARASRRTTERWITSMRDPEVAICHYWGARCREALEVAECESHLRTDAANGQYLGMFQMGDYARQLYGHGSTPREQARAAHEYFVASGSDWSPWSCKP